MTFIFQSALDIRKKLQKLERRIGMNHSQLVDIAFKYYNNRERKRPKLPLFTLNRLWSNSICEKGVLETHLKCFQLINACIAKERGT